MVRLFWITQPERLEQKSRIPKGKLCSICLFNDQTSSGLSVEIRVNCKKEYTVSHSGPRFCLPFAQTVDQPVSPMQMVNNPRSTIFLSPGWGSLPRSRFWGSRITPVGRRVIRLP